MMNRLIRLLVLYFFIVVFLTLNPWLRPDYSGYAIGFLTWDMMAHAGIYAMMAIILMLILLGKAKKLMVTVMVVFACGFLGIFLEYCQYWFTASRQLSMHDAVANFIGAILGAMIFWSAWAFWDNKTTATR